MIKLYGKPIRVNKASQDKKSLDVSANLFIGNLDPDVDEKLLYDTFSAFGVIASNPKMQENKLRKQHRDLEESIGHLHLRCTHLIVQSSRGRKFEHTLKHGARNSLFIVTIGWFVDIFKRNQHYIAG